MSTAGHQFKLRLPPELKERIESAAEQSGRSVTAEIVQRLEESFTVGDRYMSVKLQLNGAIQLTERTLKVCQDALEELLAAEKRGDPWMPRPDEAATRAEEIEGARKAVAFFETDLLKQKKLLQEIAALDMKGQSMTAAQLRERIKQLDIQII